jgi:flavin reductase (DIM6/NTAB) family NADH-FMN oxidoreductase RutF
VHEVPAGDHTVFIGRVENAGIGESEDARPLVHYRGRYSELERGP